MTPTVRFTDVAGRSAFSYTSNNDFTPRKYFPQPMCGGIALIDYDGDGKVDIFFTNGGKLPDYTRPDPSYYSCLLRGRGDGTFEEVTAKADIAGKNLDFSFGVAAGDFDNDGDPDLFVANAGPNALYRNNGDGTFTDVTAGSGLDRKRRTCSPSAPPSSTTTRTGSSTSSSRTTRSGARRPTGAAPPRTARSTATPASTRAFRTASTATSATGSSRT